MHIDLIQRLYVQNSPHHYRISLTIASIVIFSLSFPLQFPPFELDVTNRVALSMIFSIFFHSLIC